MSRTRKKHEITIAIIIESGEVLPHPLAVKQDWGTVSDIQSQEGSTGLEKF